MTRFGTYSNGSSRAWYIYSDGYIAHGYVHGTIYLSRPVFYLTENIKITSGKGSITEPFIIS